MLEHLEAACPGMDERIRELGSEYGATTGRPRRCGWFDSVLARYAARVNGLVESTGFIRTGDHGEPFSYQGLNIQEMFVTGQPQYPVERTLLTSGLVEAGLKSLAAGGETMETPHLDVHYRASRRSTFWYD